MKNFFTFIVLIMTIVFLIGSHIYWKNKTGSAGVSNGTVKSEHAEAVGKKETKGTEEKPVSFNADALEKAANWPEAAQTALEKAMLNEKKLKIALVGSEALGKEMDGWSVQLQKALLDAYGNAVDVNIFEFGERSDAFIQKGHHEEVADFQPDLVLFEPFTLNDNGKVEVEDNHENIQTFLSSIHDANEEAVVILQPPHPIFNATIYPWQVEQLERFARENNLEYLNHWPKWPDVEKEELRSYLLEDQSAPNKEGHELWFAFLKDYFIAE